MDQALAVAALGEGTVRPNPRVGCIVVRDGEVAGWGFHRAPGEPHAEVLALDRAGERARGATLYVNLEPCAHHGRTPPCVERIVSSGVDRVVASVRDPNPLVDGRGFEALREAGVRVDVGEGADEARALNAAFLHWHATGRPRVTLKAAASLDGRTAARHGVSRWITGAAARRFAHRLRMRHDAVLVGAATVRADDPMLDVRLPGFDGRQPVRVVVCGEGRLAAGCRVFRDDGVSVLVYAREGATAPVDGTPPGRVEVVAVPGGTDGRLEAAAVLDDLGRRGIQSVLVEGGAAVTGWLSAAGATDDLALFQAPRWFGSAGGRPVSEHAAVLAPDRAPRVVVRRRLALGEDLCVMGSFDRSGEGGACSRD